MTGCRKVTQHAFDRGTTPSTQPLVSAGREQQRVWTDLIFRVSKFQKENPNCSFTRGAQWQTTNSRTGDTTLLLYSHTLNKKLPWPHNHITKKHTLYDITNSLISSRAITGGTGKRDWARSFPTSGRHWMRPTTPWEHQSSLGTAKHSAPHPHTGWAQAVPSTTLLLSRIVWEHLMLSETLALVLNGVWSLESIVEVLAIIRKRCLYILSACRQTKSCGYSWLEIWRLPNGNATECCSFHLICNTSTNVTESAKYWIIWKETFPHYLKAKHCRLRWCLLVTLGNVKPRKFYNSYFAWN